MGSSQEPTAVRIETLHQNVPEPAGRCVADEAPMRRVYEHGHVPWLVRVAGFMVLHAPGPGLSSAGSGQSQRLNQSWVEAEAAEPVGGSVW